jgi:hypothetical protein
MEDRYIQFKEAVSTPDGIILAPHGIIDSVKNCVAIEYGEEGLNVLIKHANSFEWMDVQLAIPQGSEREYADPSESAVTDLLSRAKKQQ